MFLWMNNALMCHIYIILYTELGIKRSNERQRIEGRAGMRYHTWDRVGCGGSYNTTKMRMTPEKTLQ